MVFLVLLLVAVAMTTATYLSATYLSAIRRQKRDWRKYGRAGETYDKFCSRYYTRYV